jgi:hypothetical protein
MIAARTRLRAMLHDGEMVVAPGAYDGATAMLVESARYSAVYMTGAGVSATCGLPDYGLLTLTEMVAQAARVARSVEIPVIADADTGYGNELNVTRTIREYEAAGVAALHIEDQISPKRCGHLTGKEIVDREEFLIKIRAALAARRDPEMMIIARTDARAVAGMDEAVWRSNAALEAGADMIFLEATQRYGGSGRSSGTGVRAVPGRRGYPRQVGQYGARNGLCNGDRARACARDDGRRHAECSACLPRDRCSPCDIRKPHARRPFCLVWLGEMGRVAHFWSRLNYAPRTRL